MLRSIALTLFLFLFTLAAAPPPNDNFANAIALPPGPSLTIGTTVGATRQSGEPTAVELGYQSAGAPTAYSPLGFNSVWWKWTSPSNYVVKIATSNGVDNNQFDSQLGVYTGNNVGALTHVASNDDRPSLYSTGGSDVLISAVKGVTYYILIAGYDSIEGPVKLYRTDAHKVRLSVAHHPDYTVVSGTGEWRGNLSLESSTNLTQWSSVQEFLVDGVSSFSEAVPTNSHALFFRTAIH